MATFSLATLRRGADLTPAVGVGRWHWPLAAAGALGLAGLDTDVRSLFAASFCGTRPSRRYKLFDRTLTIFVDSDPRLRAGAFGRATIQIGRRCAPAIPLSAVLYGPSSA